MRVTTPEQAEVLNKLATIAHGDIELVQRAIRAHSDGNKPARLQHVIRYILQQRGRTAPQREVREVA
jgi:hypothetical protein